MPEYRYGERLTTAGAYIKHPPGASSLLQNGGALDAGRVHLVENNLVHLAAEGCRHWVLDHFGGDLVEGRGYDYDDLGEPPATWVTDTDPLRLIGWGRTTARRYGPFFVVRDEVAEDDSFIPRGVRVKVHYTTDGATPMRLFAALTRSDRPPVEGAVIWDEFTLTAGTTSTATLTLRAPGWPAGARPAAEVCRSDAGADALNVARESYPAQLWLWLGWYVASAGSNALHAISAYETRA